jgi:tetratricopeptide (TPR) repeat protein
MLASVDYQVRWSHPEYGSDVLLDASKAGQPLQFVVGEGKVISELEECVGGLKLGESTAKPVEISGDFIGNIYNVPPGASLQLHATRVASESLDSTKETGQVMHESNIDGHDKPNDQPICGDADTLSRCMAVAAELKQQGNDFFMAEDYLSAKAKYLRSLKLLRRAHKLTRVLQQQSQGNSSSSGPCEQDLEQHSQLWMSCLLNASACELKLEEITHALRHTGLALAHDKDNVKAMFRHAEALEQNGEFMQARDVLKAALQQNPTSKAIAKALSRVVASVEVDNDVAHKLAKKMFVSGSAK